MGHHIGHDDTQEQGEEPRAQESFPSLLGRDLDQRRAAKSHTAEVGKDVVGHHEGDGQEEPNEAFKDVVDDEMRLSNDEEQGHVDPGELAELELVVSFLQGQDEENEACTS